MPWEFFRNIREKIGFLTEKKVLTKKILEKTAQEMHENLDRVEDHIRRNSPEERLRDLLLQQFGIQHLPQAQLTIRQGLFGFKRKTIDPATHPEEAYSLLHSEIIKKRKLRFHDVFQFPWLSVWRKDQRGQNVEAVKAYYKMGTGEDVHEIEFANGEKKNVNNLELKEAAAIRSVIKKELKQGKKLNEVSVIAGTHKGPKTQSPWRVIGLLGALAAAGVGYAAHDYSQIPRVHSPPGQVQRAENRLTQVAHDAAKRYGHLENYGVDFGLLTRLWLERKQTVDPSFTEKHAPGVAKDFMNAVNRNLDYLARKGKVRHTTPGTADTSITLNALLKSVGLQGDPRRDAERKLLERQYKAIKGW